MVFLRTQRPARVDLRLYRPHLHFPLDLDLVFSLPLPVAGDCNTVFIPVSSVYQLRAFGHQANSRCSVSHPPSTSDHIPVFAPNLLSSSLHTLIHHRIPSYQRI